MQVGSYVLSDKEESIVHSIFNQFAAHFPTTTIQQRDSILGIGQEGYHLFCYLAKKENTIAIKFKGLAFHPLDATEAIQQDLLATIHRFDVCIKSDVDASVKMKQSSSRPPKKQEKENPSLLYDKYLTLIASVPPDKINTLFDACSRRLKNALHHNSIFAVADLLSYTPEQILLFPNLGEKSFCELCEFLTMLATDAPICLPAKNSSVLEKRLYIAKNRKKFSVSFEPTILLNTEDRIDEYKDLYHRMCAHICKTADIRLYPRNRDLLLARLGVDGEPKKLQALGDIYSLSRERVRQIVNKSMRILCGNRPINDIRLLDLECERTLLVSQIDADTVNRFAYFLVQENYSEQLISFFFKYFFRCEISIPQFRAALLDLQEKEAAQQRIIKHALFNEQIYNAITFTKKRKITTADFTRLISQRIVERTECNYVFEGREYQCESLMQQKVLKKLLAHGTFQAIKTQSLKVPIGNTYWLPDFQCLTHEGHFVLVDVKSVYDMCEYKTIQKIRALEAYCAKYGFGYLVIDASFNSFAQINEEHLAFSEAILSEVATNGIIRFAKYKEIRTRTGATVKHLLALIKAKDLHLTPYFSLTYNN